ncbi:MAG: hypothetical protein ACREVY_11040 [Gammaproteobacteria bacterium]
MTRGNPEIASSLAFLAMTGPVSLRAATGGAAIPTPLRSNLPADHRDVHKVSYKSRQASFTELIKSIFFWREPALICFSLEIAL